MNTEIKRIDSITNMAVFKSFRWTSSVVDLNGGVADFKKINIIYGRNYAGKTTLSRIFRAIETGVISDKYNSPEFHISFNDGLNITQGSLTGHNRLVRVFNEDFVRENLRFISNSEDNICSFAILGEDNTRIEEAIRALELELGNSTESTGLIGEEVRSLQALNLAQASYESAKDTLEDKLREKANKAGVGIKHNKIYGDANYNVKKIQDDIDKVTASTYLQLTPEKVAEHHGLLKEEPRHEIEPSPPLNLKLSSIINQAQTLVEKEIKASSPIQDLLHDAVLAEWVRRGREYHEGKRENCAFCGNALSEELWLKLDKHFNKESEELRSSIDRLLSTLESEKVRCNHLLEIRTQDFYSDFTKDLNQLATNLSSQTELYSAALESVSKALEERKSNIFTAEKFHAPVFDESGIISIRNLYEDLRCKSNATTASLSKKQTDAKTALRLNEVSTFISDIQYLTECKNIENLKRDYGEAEIAFSTAREKAVAKRAEVMALRAQLKDESKGADQVNDYLNNFFGHQSLSLKAIEDSTEGSSTGYRFEVHRDGQKAFHLSEGESSLIAFCYFMAKLEDIETKGNQPIIWIDDPISSLDSNHIFFVYSLINAKIVSPEVKIENGQQQDIFRYKQLFVSTHNLDFLKYLKRLPGAADSIQRQFFIINRENQNSTIAIMPKYLKNYVTEFNFLFHQIYKCANAEIATDDNHDCYYNFGNNARKFLEAFLYFKYPNAQDKDDKLFRFFGHDPLSSSLTDRMNNEYSHLAGLFERSTQPIDVPEMKSTATFILNKIKERDGDQYEALLQSIGAT